MGLIVDYKNVEVDRAERMVLHDVTFQMQEGEFCYLVGRVGSGKSSLMKTMYADVPVAGGEKADVLGFDLLTLKKKQIPYLRRAIGIVFQDFQLLQDRSALANLRFVLEATGWKSKPEMEARIEEVLKAVGMENKATRCLTNLAEVSSSALSLPALCSTALNLSSPMNPRVILIRRQAIR